MCSSVCELVVTACIGCRTTQLQRKATGKKGPPTELECSIVEFPLLKLWNGSLFFIYHLPLCAGHGCAADFDCLRLFSCCLSLELCCPTASYTLYSTSSQHYCTCTTDTGNYVHHPPQASGLVQHGSRLLSPLPSSAQLPASRPRVLSGRSRRHIRDRYIRGDGRWSLTDSIACMAESPQ